MFVSKYNDFVLKVEKFDLNANAIVEVDNKKFKGIVKEIACLSNCEEAYDDCCDSFTSDYCGEFVTDFDIFYVGIDLV